MRKTSGSLVILLVSAVLTLLPSCGSGLSEKKMAWLSDGRWVCGIDDGEYFGKQTLSFGKNGDFLQYDDLTFSSEDSGFDFEMGVRVVNEGRWEIAGDSLYICYSGEKLNIVPDVASFVVRTVTADLEVNEEVKQGMGNQLKDFIDNDMKQKYEVLSGRRLFLGRIREITPKTLTIKQADVYLILNNTGSLFQGSHPSGG